MSKKVKEIIIYRIRPEKLDDFDAIKARMIEESLTLPGIHSCTTARLIDEEGAFVDTMVWDSKEASQQALPLFEKLPTASTFLGLMAGPPLAQHFMEYEPDNVGEPLRQ